VVNKRHLYDGAVQRMNYLGILTGTSDSAVAVVDRARPPQITSSPRVKESLIIALALGLAGDIGIALLLESFDDGIKSPADAQRLLDLPILGTIPDFGKLGYNGSIGLERPSRHKPIAIPWLGASDNDVGGGRELIVSQAASAAAEAYRAVRTALVFSKAGSPPKTLAVTSAVLGEGKTVTTLNISVCFAQLGGRTLLIDADLRRPRCHHVLGLENRNGLSDVLAGRLDPKDAIRPTAVPRLSLIPSGSHVPNPTELVSSSFMRDLVAILSEQFDHVLIDSPPIMPVSDTVTMARMVDGILLIVGTDTPRQVVTEACSRLDFVGAKVLGVVLNKVNVSSPDYRYYNGYTYRYSYDCYQ
jgi:capsular exopolysaccharide synthesis family protein